MTDRELLEMAAKAAGYTIRLMDREGRTADIGPNRAMWEPLDDDGDALRLAVALRMQLDILDRSVYAFGMNGAKVSELDRADIGAATRRAIVRAAAEIGRAMP
jgi:hypothetical protein